MPRKSFHTTRNYRMPTCGLLRPTCLTVLLVFALSLLTVTPVASDSASKRETFKTFNTDDFFSIPADLFLHQHSLARHSEQIISFKEPAHRVKTVDGWTSSSEAQEVTIDHKLVSDSFFYHNSETGAVTNVTSVFETVADTVYFDQIPSVESVSCDGDFITVKYNSSSLDGSSKDFLAFGTKCAHFAPNIRVTGGNAFFCNTPSASSALVFRQIISVVSCTDDPASGRCSSIKLNTAEANPLTFYNSISDYNLNGSMALIPKRLFRPNSKVDFFELSRQFWKERQNTGVHLKGVTCTGTDTQKNRICFDMGYGGTGVHVGMEVQRSEAHPFSHFLLPPSC
jgi:hypothetical protein